MSCIPAIDSGHENWIKQRGTETQRHTEGRLEHIQGGLRCVSVSVLLCLVLFFGIEAGREVIDFDVIREIIFVVRTKDLAGKLFFQRLLASFRPEPLGAASRWL